MKTKILSQIAALMALGVATQGCSDNWTADVGGEGEGVLATSSLLPTVTNEEHFVEEIRGAQQNGRSGGSRASINLTDFIDRRRWCTSRFVDLRHDAEPSHFPGGKLHGNGAFAPCERSSLE